MEHLVEEAFRVAIETEKNSRDLYLEAAGIMPEGTGKAVLSGLAEEQSKIVARLVNCCPYSVSDALKRRASHVTPPLEGHLVGHERRLLNVLRLALNDRHDSVTLYETLLQAFRDPGICRVLELALEMTQGMLRRIIEERRQAELRLQGPFINRRRKRTHIRSSFGRQPVTNKHCQLFISLLDAGRQSPP